MMQPTDSAPRALHDIRFPPSEPHSLAQDEAFFLLCENEEDVVLRFHDYAEIFKRPGLYEQLFYQRLRCNSPRKAQDILEKVMRENALNMSELRVLDLGAGNGMVGELLDVARMVGIDICDEARKACERDRPGAYDAYHVLDMAALDPDTERQFWEWQFDCLTCIAALGFGDIPVTAFARAFNLIVNGGWTIFNIKETFLQEIDNTGFSKLVKQMLFTDMLEIHHLERYRHRVSIDGAPLFYYLLCGRKRSDISLTMLAS